MKKDKNPLEPEVSLFDKLFGVKENMGYKKKSSKRPIDMYNESRNNTESTEKSSYNSGPAITIIFFLIFIAFGISIILPAFNIINFDNIDWSKPEININEELVNSLANEKIAAGYHEDMLDLELVDKFVDYGNRGYYSNYLTFLTPEEYGQKILKMVVTDDMYKQIEIGDIASVAVWINSETNDVAPRTNEENLYH